MKSVTRRLALRQADLEDGACPAAEEFRTALGDRAKVTVALEHRDRGTTPVGATFEARLSHAGERRLTGIDWPADLQPGVLITVTWRAAEDEVVLRSIALHEPMRIDGVDYFHEYDPAVVTREFVPDGSNWAQVLHTVRSLGHVFDDGSAVFAESQLAAHCGLGRGGRGSFLLRNAVDQLLREGWVTRVDGSVDAAGHPCYPAVDGQEPADMLLYAPLVEPAPTGEGTDRREHWVNGFLRKLPPGAHASERQLTLHQRTAEEDASLPAGYTYVKKHHRHG